MKRYRLTAGIGTLALAATIQIIFPMHVSAINQPIQISITDEGFSPNQITATVNQEIKIHVVNRGQKAHQFSIPYYRIYTRALGSGQTSDIAFTPWTAGKFEFTSDPSGSDNPEFSGNFIVAPE
jgi:heme/copper-type cytochrome/quinol oxidase subunit 2